ncbi:hypothetical protein B0H66DRAFT_535037 [Apodospora peruviana]|uniref:Uncharacterized protein n=1 Tax=Apodospora peruviana TaxID=516989 RepID=A0AAE0I1M6_9PEZI|nr:hypothetical protein B0H66DRAFT_535037 [Apodospora peruviana]
MAIGTFVTVVAEVLTRPQPAASPGSVCHRKTRLQALQILVTHSNAYIDGHEFLQWRNANTQPRQGNRIEKVLWQEVLAYTMSGCGGDYLQGIIITDSDHTHTGAKTAEGGQHKGHSDDEERALRAAVNSSSWAQHITNLSTTSGNEAEGDECFFSMTPHKAAIIVKK